MREVLDREHESLVALYRDLIISRTKLLVGSGSVGGMRSARCAVANFKARIRAGKVA